MDPQGRYRWMRGSLECVVALVFLSGSNALAGDLSFNRDIRPILADRCFSCHGADARQRKAKLRLDRAEGEAGAYRVRDDAAAIKPGAPDESELWRRITTKDRDEVMPPPKAHKKPLSEKEKATLKSWIEAGAPYEEYWAFVPPKMPAAAKVKNPAWSRQPIDLYVLKRLEAEKLKPAAEADKRALIRRLTFDLTGLPPTRDEVRAFIENKKPGAYQELVDELLSRPQYGEHIARYLSLIHI